MHILHNACIHTLNSSNPFAEALAIDNGTITCIGKENEILALAKSPQDLEDMQGKTIFPGFTDSHIHTYEYGKSLSSVNCETATKQICLSRVASQATHTPIGEWIFGHGWNHNVWPEGMGNAQELDAISEMHPIFLSAKSMHAAWVNSPVLYQAGINAQTPDPYNGKIERDSRGNPTGILLESAQRLAEKIIPKPTLEQICQTLLKAQEALLQFGITAIHDVDCWESLQAFQKLRRIGKLRLRVVKSIPHNYLENAINMGLHTGEGNNWLHIGWLKLFADGALGPQTAAMLEPYEGKKRGLGTLSLNAHTLYEIGCSSVKHGISLEIHAIGDRANREALNAFEALNKNTRLPQLRIPHRIEHVQLITPQDQQRLAKLQITASMQPIHVISDKEIAEYYWGIRCRFAYAWQSILKSGALLIFGSDAPVESPNPFLGLHAAITRKSRNDLPTTIGWHPEQCLKLEEAIAAYISAPPQAAGLGNQIGKLSPHSFADLVVLPSNPYKLPDNEIANLKPIATMVNGEWVWHL